MIRILIAMSLLLVLPPAWAADESTRFQPELSPANLSQWKLIEGKWRILDGALEQTDSEPLTAAIHAGPAFKDFKLTAEVNIRATGKGVRAAAILFRATGTKSFYWLHLDSNNKNAIFTKCSPEVEHAEILRRPIKIQQDTWHKVRIECRGSNMVAFLDDTQIFEAQDSTLTAGRIGVGTSQGAAAFRNIQVEGTQVANPEPLKNERTLHQIISKGELAGPYQAFPDACRLPNGDILAVFYAGFSHISLPNDKWPRGGRICQVRSKDEGATWSTPSVLFDGPLDDRDPHIAVSSDGTLRCTFFTYYKGEGGKEVYDTCLVTSKDGGTKWETEPRILGARWAVSAPVRELKDGTLLLGIYTEAKGTAFGGVVRSTDKGQTWSAPIPIDPESGVRLDAETDVIQLLDGSVFAALRGDGKVHMHYSISKDAGLTWSPVKDIGFLGHCPHLTRLSSGEILLTHRIPNTALHVSRDDGQTWGNTIPIDGVIGAYASTVELKDKSVLVIYYEEGGNSAIRAMRFRLEPNGIKKLPWD